MTMEPPLGRGTFRAVSRPVLDTKAWKSGIPPLEPNLGNATRHDMHHEVTDSSMCFLVVYIHFFDFIGEIVANKSEA